MVHSGNMDPVARRLVEALAGLQHGALVDWQAVRLLSLLPAEEAAAALSSLLSMASPAPGVRHALAALCRALLPHSSLPAEVRSAIHRAAAAHHHPAVVALMSNAAPALPPGGKLPRPVRAPDEETLGHRTQRARAERSRDRLLKLCHDDDPAVIRNLLLNPRLTEAGAVRVCTRRPVPAAVLEEVARSPRWNTRPAVRKALVQNPFSPTSLASALLPQLGQTALRELLADPVVHPAVRDGARALLVARRSAG